MLESAEKYQVAFDKLDFEDTSYVEYFGDGSSPLTVMIGIVHVRL